MTLGQEAGSTYGHVWASIRGWHRYRIARRVHVVREWGMHSPAQPAGYDQVKGDNLTRLVAELARRQTRLSALPAGMNLLLTRRCNIACTMCVVNRGRPRASMSPEMFSRLAEECFPTLYYIHTMLGGEPLMHPHLDETIVALRRYGVRLRLTTNATLLDAEMVSRMDGVLEWLKASIDSCRKDVYESIRRGAQFDQVAANLRHFGEARNRLNPAPKFMLGLVMMASNIAELPDYVRFAADVGADAVEFMRLAAEEGDPERLYGQEERVNALMRQALRVADERNIAVLHGLPLEGDGQPKRDPLPYRYGYLPLPPQAAQVVGPPYWFAGPPVCAQPFIEEDGAVFSCGNTRPFLLGMLGKQSFREVWNGPAYLALRAAKYAAQGAWHPFCQACVGVSRRYGQEMGEAGEVGGKSVV